MRSRLSIFFLFCLAAGPATAPAPPLTAPDLIRQIAQRRDPASRASAIERVRAMLASSVAHDQLEALHALAGITDVNIDHAPFEPLVRGLIAAGHETSVRVAAMDALPNYGGRPDDLPTLVAFADDPAPEIRIACSRTYVAINGRIPDRAFDALVLKLLSDPDARVQHGALYALARVPLGASVEAKLVAMSRDPAVQKDKSLMRDVVMYGLTTRPTTSLAIANRLLDLMADGPTPELPDGVQRATWQFRNSDTDPAAQPAVVDGLVASFNDSLNPTVRDNCIVALGKIGTDAAFNALADIAADPDQDDHTRDAATRAMNAK